MDVEDDDDIIPMAFITNKPKLKSFSFANSLTSLFKTNNTLKEINFNATTSATKPLSLGEAKVVSPMMKTLQKINTDEQIVKPKMVVTPIEETKPCTSNATTTNVNTKKRPREEDENENNNKCTDIGEERDFKRPNFSQVDYRDKK